MNKCEHNGTCIEQSRSHYATSCKNTSWQQIIPCVQVGRIVVATYRSDKSLHMSWRIFAKTFVSMLLHKLQKIKSDWICVTCYSNKILLQWQRGSQKYTSIHNVICCCVAATCGCKLLPCVYCPLKWLCHKDIAVSGQFCAELTS